MVIWSQSRYMCVCVCVCYSDAVNHNRKKCNWHLCYHHRITNCDLWWWAEPEELYVVFYKSRRVRKASLHMCWFLCRLRWVMENLDPKIYVLRFIMPAGPRYHITLYVYVYGYVDYDLRQGRPDMVYIMFNSSGASVMSHVIKFCIDISIEGVDCDLRYEVNGVLNGRIWWIYEVELILF